MNLMTHEPRASSSILSRRCFFLLDVWLLRAFDALIVVALIFRFNSVSDLLRGPLAARLSAASRFSNNFIINLISFGANACAFFRLSIFYELTSHENHNYQHLTVRNQSRN